ncbi:MAG: hypothetical protein IKV82_03230 [Akkermansia sp.]|nr:hypothetical protein [Akkermansia sp.]
MCVRKENEPLVVYLLRYVAEQPRAMLALLGFIAAGYMYFDLMAFVRENTASMRDIGEQVRVMSEQVREANTRLQHLEREHEAARMGGVQ